VPRCGDGGSGPARRGSAEDAARRGPRLGQTNATTPAPSQRAFRALRVVLLFQVKSGAYGVARTVPLARHSLLLLPSRTTAEQLALWQFHANSHRAVHRYEAVDHDGAG
jgi:hypothetical protein